MNYGVEREAKFLVLIESLRGYSIPDAGPAVLKAL